MCILPHHSPLYSLLHSGVLLEVKAFCMLIRASLLLLFLDGLSFPILVPFLLYDACS